MVPGVGPTAGRHRRPEREFRQPHGGVHGETHGASGHPFHRRRQQQRHDAQLPGIGPLPSAGDPADAVERHGRGESEQLRPDLDLYRNDADSVRRDFWSASISDDETRETIREAFDRFGYVFDPHGAVGYAAWKRYGRETGAPHHGIVLETAHPAKFPEIVDPSSDKKFRFRNGSPSVSISR